MVECPQEMASLKKTNLDKSPNLKKKGTTPALKLLTVSVHDFRWLALNVKNAHLLMNGCLPAAECPHPLASHRVPVRHH